jgi:O-antigen/teichoic acid export membrane protein
MLKNSSLNLSSGLVRLVAGVLSTVILSSTWPPSDFGYWAYISAIAGIAASFDLGLAIYAGSLSSASRKWQDHFEEIGRIFILAIITAGVASLFLNGVSATLVSYIHSEDSGVNLPEVLAETCIGLVGARMLSNIGLAALSGQARYSFLLLISLCQSLSVLVLNLGTVALGLGFAGNLKALSVLNVAWALIIVYSATCEKKFFCFRRALALSNFSVDKFLMTAKNSISLFPSSFSSSCFANLDKVIVGASIGAQNLAFYTISSIVASQINSVAALISQPIVHLVPMSDTDFQTKHNLDRYARLILVVCPLLGLILILGSPLIGARFFPHLGDIVEILKVEWAIGAMAFVYSLYSLNCYGHYYWLARKKYGLVSAVGVVSSFGTLAAMFIVRGEFGLLGLVACNLVYAISVLLTVVAIRDNDTKVRSSLFFGSFIYGASMLLLAFRYSHSWHLGFE